MSTAETDTINGMFSSAKTPNEDASDSPSSLLKVSCISDITPKPIIPIWPGCLYRGKVTVMAGVPGDGKSLSTLDLIARKSSGGAWPVGNGRFTASPVALLTAEDDPADTIRPRLDLAGANADNVSIIEGTYRINAKTGERTLDLVSLLNDLALIEALVVERGIEVLVIDPLTSFADSDSNKTADMRRLLDAISQMAARTGLAVLVVTHLNKRSDARKAMQLVAGSHVIVAAVRVVLVTARDPNDKGRRLLLPIKLNIDRDDSGFAFRIAPKAHPICGEVPAIEWESERIADISADDALIDSTPRAQAAVEKSAEVQLWLRELLKAGPVEAQSMWRKADDADYSKRRVRDGLKAIGAVAECLGYQGKWHYRMPESTTKADRG